MPPILSTLTALAIALSIAAPVAAQQQRVAAGELRLAGYAASCGPIETSVMHFDDIAASAGSLIYLNPRLFAMPRAQQMFWYMHECGHQMFGPSERAADCWSVRQGRQQGWLTFREFERLESIIGSLPGDAAHASGPVRAAFMRQCYAG